MTQTTFLCFKCWLRIPTDQRVEHLEAIHKLCGRRYCETPLTDGKCEKCDNGKTEV